MNQELRSTAPDPVSDVRAFNRFYTRRIGVLNEGLLDSEFSLTEVRVMYELAHRSGITASELAQDLGIDPGYLSRILRKFQTRGLLLRMPSPTDGRQILLSLTSKGRQAFAPLDEASQREVSALLEALPAPRRAALLEAMSTIRRVLDGSEPNREPYLLRPLQVGDIGWIAHRHGLLYAREYGWDEHFEALVAEIAGSFVRNFDPRRERCWVAEREGAVVGSVFAVRESDSVAKLRLLYVEPEARGLGIGSRLVDECVRFTRERGYLRLTLWTVDLLHSARRIYQAAGFQLVREEPVTGFGDGLTGQFWELELQ